MELTTPTALLPAQLVPVRDHLPRQLGADEGVLFHSTTLSDLIRLAAGAQCPLALDLDSAAVLQQLNAERRLTPASLTKLAVAAATLNRWSADKAFETRLVGHGALHAGELAGDVIFDGSGDPTLEYHALLALAVQAVGAGVTAVRGRVVVNLAPFAEVGCETPDRCGALLRSDTAFNAPLSAVGIDYGNWCVSVQPTSIGAAAQVRGCGVAHLPIPVEGSIITSAAPAKKTFWVERATHAGVDVLRVGGQLPSGAGERVYRAMSNPALGVGLLLRESLREVGVRVPGDVTYTLTVNPGAAAPGAPPLDRFRENNRYVTTATVPGRPSVLYVEGDEGRSQYFRDALAGGWKQQPRGGGRELDREHHGVEIPRRRRHGDARRLD